MLSAANRTLTAISPLPSSFPRRRWLLNSTATHTHVAQLQPLTSLGNMGTSTRKWFAVHCRVGLFKKILNCSALHMRKLKIKVAIVAVTSLCVVIEGVCWPPWPAAIDDARERLVACRVAVKGRRQW